MQTSGSRTRLVDRLIPTHIILYVYGRPRGEHPSFSARYHMKEEPMIEHPPFLVTAFANRVSKPSPKAAESPANDQATRPHRDIGP